MAELPNDIEITGEEHWTDKGEDVRLFLWEKYADKSSNKIGTVLFVHGSSMASQPTFDLTVKGRPFSSVMDWFAARGFDTWTVDMERNSSAGAHALHPAPISSTEPDWSREEIQRWWQPSNQLLGSIRAYQRAKASGGLIGWMRC